MKKILWTALALALAAPAAIGCESRAEERQDELIEDRAERAEELRERNEEVREERNEMRDEMEEGDVLEERREGAIEIRGAQRGESELERSVDGLSAEGDRNDDTTVDITPDRDHGE
jgi:hypothetical protein